MKACGFVEEVHGRSTISESLHVKKVKINWAQQTGACTANGEMDR